MKIMVFCFEKKIPFLLHEEENPRKLARLWYHKLREYAKVSDIQ